MQKTKTPDGEGIKTADELAGNKLAQMASEKARAAVEAISQAQKQKVTRYRCGAGSCKGTSDHAGGVCRPVAYEVE